ncbi:MAG: DUF4347 domain-containing protein [Rhizobiales bacterium]|nr:DUF4347 domain-containing protein [Hyphomicrobiales bacterium]
MTNFDRHTLLNRMISIGKSASFVDFNAKKTPVLPNLSLAHNSAIFMQKNTFVSLEPRILFDASLGDAVSDLSADYAADADLDDNNFLQDPIVDPVIDALLGEVYNYNNLQKTIVFVDAEISDISVFLALDDPAIEFYSIDKSQNPFGQIAQILAGREGLSSIHILSHGNTGRLHIGGLDITSSDLVEFGAELAIIGESLADTGDILIYGCNVAEGASGRQFLQAMAMMTNADVAGSNNWTGDQDIGGDWLLEESAGSIETAALFDQIEQIGFDRLLAAPTIDAPASVTMLEDTSHSFTLFDSTDISVDDLDFDPVSMRLEVSNGTLTVTNINGIVTGIGTSTVEISLSSLNDVNTVLASLVYTPTNHFNGSDPLTVTVDDGSSTVASIVAIDVLAVNDAPTVTVPVGAIIVPEGEVFQIPGIIVGDEDAGSGLWAVELWVSNGVLSLDTSGVTVIFSSLSGDAIEITGSIAALNISLSTLEYTANAGYTGADAVGVIAKDNGNSGIGGPQITTDTVPLNVIAITIGLSVSSSDAVLGAYTETETDFPNIQISDIGVNNNIVRMNISVSNGELHSDSISNGSVAVLNGNPAGDSFFTIQGTLAQLNSVLANLSYTSNQSYTGPDTLAVVVIDTSNPFISPKFASDFVDLTIRDLGEIDFNVADAEDTTPKLSYDRDKVFEAYELPDVTLTLSNVLSEKDREFINGFMANTLARGELPDIEMLKQLSMRLAVGDDAGDGKLFSGGRDSIQFAENDVNTDASRAADEATSPSENATSNQSGDRDNSEPDSFEQGVEQIIRDFSGSDDNDSDR